MAPYWSPVQLWGRNTWVLRGLGQMALLSTFVLNAHPAYLQGNLLGLKKDQITNKGGPFLWIFRFYIGFTFFEVSAPFCLFRFLDP